MRQGAAEQRRRGEEQEAGGRERNLHYSSARVSAALKCGLRFGAGYLRRADQRSEAALAADGPVGSCWLSALNVAKILSVPLAPRAAAVEHALGVPAEAGLRVAGLDAELRLARP